jgi:enoyl-CoA hydratase
MGALPVFDRTTEPEEFPMSSDDLLIRVDGCVGRLTMNRPAALNALTHPMVGMMTAALQLWADDPAIELVILDGAGGRALCAGGDVLSLYSAHTQGSAFARSFWAEEYRLNSLISRYPKPFVAIQDGIVMGGGIGLSGHASHRIVTEKSMLAMPETSIGLIPDVGGTWLLAHASGEFGTYLGLTGARMTAADAIEAGFADYVIESSDLAAWLNPAVPPQDGRRIMTSFTKLSSPDAVSAALETFEMSIIPAGKLASNRAEINAAFAHDRVEDIIAHLEAHPTEFATRTLRDLSSKSPKALKLTLAALRYARAQTSLEACLNMEYRLVTRLYEDGEFIEGVRALLVDKDKAPKWRPATFTEVTDDMVLRYIAPLPPGEELGLSAATI